MSDPKARCCLCEEYAGESLLCPKCTAKHDMPKDMKGEPVCPRCRSSLSRFGCVISGEKAEFCHCRAPIAPQFQVGDVVQLKSGGPPMTVTKLYLDELCTVAYKDGDRVHFVGIPSACLRKWEMRVLTFTPPSPQEQHEIREMVERMKANDCTPLTLPVTISCSRCMNNPCRCIKSTLTASVMISCHECGNDVEVDAKQPVAVGGKIFCRHCREEMEAKPGCVPVVANVELVEGVTQFTRHDPNFKTNRWVQVKTPLFTYAVYACKDCHKRPCECVPDPEPEGDAQMHDVGCKWCGKMASIPKSAVWWECIECSKRIMAEDPAIGDAQMRFFKGEK